MAFNARNRDEKAAWLDVLRLQLEKHRRRKEQGTGMLLTHLFHVSRFFLLFSFSFFYLSSSSLILCSCCFCLCLSVFFYVFYLFILLSLSQPFPCFISFLLF